MSVLEKYKRTRSIASYRTLFFTATFLFLFSIASYALASPPGSAFVPGETLDPSCAPGATNCYVDTSGGAGMAIGGTITSATAGSVLFATTGGNLAQDTTHFFYDGTAHRLGLGTATPAETLDVNGNIQIPTTTSSAGIIKQNGAAFIHTFGTSNAFIGASAGNFTLTGSLNVGLGVSTLSSLTSGGRNVALGVNSQVSTTSGNRNTAVGYQSLNLNSTGSFNTAVGDSALLFNTGSSNAAFGYSAMRGPSLGTSASNNAAFGSSALFNTTGNSNVGVGDSAGITNDSGTGNVFIGVASDAAASNYTNATALGYHAIVGASNSLVLGGTGSYAVTVGIGTTTPRTALELGGDGALLATGTFGSGFTEPNLGAGTRLLFYPRKGAFRAGTVSSTEWDDANIGSYSAAFGNNTLASNSYAFAAGATSTASGFAAIALGNNANASGDASVALGATTTASGAGSFAVGNMATASGDASIALGTSIEAKSYLEIALGTNNTVYTPNSTTGWDPADRLFGIGNGTNSLARSDALTILKNGDAAFTSQNSTGTLANSGFVLNENSLTSGTGMYLASSSITSGRLLDIEITNGGSGSQQTGLFLQTSGGNVSPGETTFGAYIQNAHTGTSSSNYALSIDSRNGDTNTGINAVAAGGSTSTALYASANGASVHNYAAIFANGYVGVNNLFPSYMLHVGSSSTTSGTTVARFENAGGTCDVTPNTAGGITCTSDERLKENITDYQGGLAAITALRSVNYSLIKDTDHSMQIGFLAQDLESVLPSLVRTDAQGFKSVSYAGLTPVLAEAVKELDVKIEPLSSLDTANSSSLGGLIKTFLANAGNSITDLFAEHIHTDKIETKELCVGATCVTEDQFLRMVQQSETNPNPNPNPNPAPSPSTPASTDATASSVIDAAAGNTAPDTVSTDTAGQTDPTTSGLPGDAAPAPSVP